MSRPEVNFVEPSDLAAVDPVPLAHMSVELGRIRAQDCRGGTGLRDFIERAKPLAELARSRCAVPHRARISTCVVVDDYFEPFGSPESVLPRLLDAAAKADVGIDYLLRESACVNTGDLGIATLVLGLIVPDPPPGTDGRRPPFDEVGWLSNGMRSPAVALEAMQSTAWHPPRENAASHHSVFVDVELWRSSTENRRWSAAFVTAVRQLLRLGVLRHHGQRVLAPVRWQSALPDRWDDLPGLVQLQDRAEQFCAHRTFTILPGHDLHTAVAARTILDQIAVSGAVAQQIAQRVAGDKLAARPEIVDRTEYAFTGLPWT